MSKKHLKKIGIILIVLVFTAGGYAGYRFYQAQHLAGSLLAEAEKEAQNASYEGKNAGIAGNDGTVTGQGNEPGAPNENPKNGSAVRAKRPAIGERSSGGSGSSTADGNYKQKMESTHNLALGAMYSVKDNTLALQKRKLSVSQYRGTIAQAKCDFTEAQTFAENNPPSDPELTPYYHEFLSGIILANQAMDTVLKGISSLNPSSLFAAKDMGSTALDKIMNGYNHF